MRYLLVYMCGASSLTCVGRWQYRDGRFPLMHWRNTFSRRTAYNFWWRWISAEVLLWGA